MRKGVTNNLILCVEYFRWVYKRCSGIKGKLESNVDFGCRRCLEEGPAGTVLQKKRLRLNPKLECVPKFCYLGDTLDAGGGAYKAARARVRCAWASSKNYRPS